MTEHDYEKAAKLLLAVELDIRTYLKNPTKYHAEYFEDVHCCMTEALSLLDIDTGVKDYDYYETED